MNDTAQPDEATWKRRLDDGAKRMGVELDESQVEALWQGAVQRFSRVDIWINNAGLGGMMRNFWEQPAEELSNIVQANVIGSMYGCRVALAGMVAQGSGALYNMEGSGSDGSVRP